ncbi:hypothetical protein AGMMS49546_29220 [Spirochaetia bacterium]|nr:hypothetical protein AGMMS49546_29220 [Spirochaetia bacterium]
MFFVDACFGRRMVCLVYFFVFIGIFSAFAMGNAQGRSAISKQETVVLAELAPAGRDPASEKVEAEQGPGNPLNPQGTAPERQEQERGEAVMKALAAAYPDRVGPAVRRQTSPGDTGDWAVPVRGVWYYYAEGRLLPEELRDKAADYDPQPFYNYAENLPPWREPGPEETARFRDQAARRQQHPPKRSQHFYDALWRAHTRDESYDRLKSIRLFGKTLLIHYAIMEELALVEERILAEAKTNPQVRQWINGLNTLDAWNWRSIADTQSRSFHAYGAALDLLPKSSGRLETYWLWTARTQPEWWAIPYEKRLHPPEPVIKAFEAYGFIWGGKWLFYDTMHFEYRPEILILNKLPISDLR